ncbi:chemotaxis protein CheA [Myxococcus llanfairpwllgwyngyllgogerychwyrndrobwllllantysiliogogogochensis]|uniref:histidine kinase n=1 Tax=Myxococcus llanfairpwllgwyngyllgogerychwyrndrobwllllantysiliogogogochensis TaxID=2590453 RepID=A0A540X1I0_9BACT|nr:chemotaxis protein CheW [Myxococcus llanfairpwllgwyngyllgogerychwyrndrobwllllantysiliogogogochensis]TQF15125.1 chemotaxis protein CheA [Myxococcus llanfairpwllgwyngyllgogerychwyrndrobwllllantysiliogogogochensis]
MTASVDLADFLPAYLAEVEELLDSAHRQLMAVEASARRGAAHPKSVRELFRALHTIKGLSAMVDVEPIVSISHWMETSLRQADQAGGRLPESSVEPLMEGLRAVEQRMRQLAAGKDASPVPPGLLERLEALGVSSPVVASTARPSALLLDETLALAPRLTPTEREQLTSGAGHRRPVRVDFIPGAERAARGITINSVRERLAALGELVKVVPVAGPAPGGGSLTFVLLLSTDASDAVLKEAAGGEPAQVRALSTAPSAVDGPSVPEREPELEEEPEEGRRSSGTLRVEVSRLDEALERLAALVVNRSRLQRAVVDLTAVGAPTRELRAILQENGRQLRDMRAAILRLRMVRVGDVLERLPLLVRGLRRTTGKAVRLELEVGDAELDKAVADRMLPALVHLVRNAVDHALESPEERRAAGKPPEGRVRLGCHANSSGWVDITVADDGRGVDAGAVARRAGVPVPRGPDDLLELLCRPGFSTREEVTSTSGRGMGMDIVRRIVVDQLGGELRLETRVGEGTTFHLRVPLTITLLDAIIFECAGLRYAVAVGSVEELIEVEAARVVRPAGAHGVALVERRGQSVTLVSLARLLGSASAQAVDATPPRGLVVRQRGELVAFGVDRLLGQQEIVLRPLEDPLVRVPGVAGATDLGDGQPTLVLDLNALGAARRPGSGGREERAT